MHKPDSSGDGSSCEIYLIAGDHSFSYLSHYMMKSRVFYQGLRCCGIEYPDKTAITHGTGTIYHAPTIFTESPWLGWANIANHTPSHQQREIPTSTAVLVHRAAQPDKMSAIGY